MRRSKSLFMIGCLWAVFPIACGKAGSGPDPHDTETATENDQDDTGPRKTLRDQPGSGGQTASRDTARDSTAGADAADSSAPDSYAGGRAVGISLAGAGGAASEPDELGAAGSDGGSGGCSASAPEQVFGNPYIIMRHKRFPDRRIVLGVTHGGRYLFMSIQHLSETRCRPIHARDMEKEETRAYLKALDSKGR